MRSFLDIPLHSATLGKWALFCGALMMCSSQGFADNGDTMELVVGQQQVLTVPGIKRVAIANPAVADVKALDGGDLLVSGVAPGKTELTLWQGEKILRYVITVSTANSPKQVADLLNSQLSQIGLPGARATAVGNTIFVEGVVDSEADLKKAEIILRGRSDTIQSALKVGAARMVELDVEFVEVSKSSLDRIGVRWPTDLDAQLSLEYASATVLRGEQPDLSRFSAQASGNASFGLSLQFNDGVTRTLARPRLVTASSKEAQFLAGGEVPIPVVTQDRIYVDYKQYGIKLQITPVVDGAGTVRAKILTEISDIDDAVAVNGFPGFLTRRVDTEVTVRDGDTIVLSGLIHLSEGKEVSKVPLLGQIPILGELFKSRRFRDRQTELVVFVTPRIVDPLSKHLQELSKDMLRKYDKAKDDVGFSIFD